MRDTLPRPLAEIPRPGANAALFLRRWLANPLQMGSVVPSSPVLCQRIAERVTRGPDEYVLELGAGTGVLSRALLRHHVPPERLIVVEIEPAMAAWLRETLPGVRVVCGDAFDLARSLPPEARQRIGTVICGIPLVLLPLERQRRFLASLRSVAGSRGFLLYSYCITSPLPWRKLNLQARREAWTPWNIPPASVWRYTPAA
ncbi:methyltransferase domain-containing protein [Roseomonas sp. M0104]|uniref:Methyltransferase domain-containing protein n=1 Tax=Teichococcus coralli TaxID=2545983 RepID=A0A845B950_9PROT|nr:methyltransferase domain-containing protein [Pseudoroseomonas coralli]MXP61922.1 methyltransferase domain-containing protein [Pseudoroseomonas coralli]